MKPTRRQFLAGFLVGAGTGVGLINPAVSAITDTKIYEGAAIQLSGHAFGTGWQLTLPSATRIAPVVAEISRIISLINEAFSPWNPDSDISRFNRSDEQHWVSVSPVCSQVMRHALDIAFASNGAFDPTIGPLVHRYGLGPIAGRAEADYRLVQLQPSALCKTQAELTLDPCGIAKGYALDLMVEALLVLGVDQHLIELGGEIKASGTHPSGRAWVTGIEAPQIGTRKPLLRISALANKALATSGLRYNSYTVGQRRYSHIIDPEQGQPVSGSLLSVSVISHSAMHADAWSTALMAAGESDGLRLARRLELDALFVSEASNTESIDPMSLDAVLLPDKRVEHNLPALRAVATGGFQRHVLSDDTV